MDIATVSSGEKRDDNDRLALDQLRLAVGNVAPNKWLIPPFAAILCGIFWQWVPHLRLAAWFVVVLAALVPMGILGRQFLKDEKALEHLNRWRTQLTIANYIFAIAWALMGPVLWVRGNVLNHMLVLLVLCTTLAADSALVSASKRLSLAGTICFGSMIVLMPLLEGGATYYWLAAAALCFGIYMYHLSGQVHATAREMLMLREDKNDLIAALTMSKAESDEARERAEAANRSKSEFLANMSHELRTPLNAILGFSEMITTGVAAKQPGRHEEYASMIHNSGHLLLALINDILDLAKIEAGGLMLREKEVNLPALLSDCARLMQARAENAGLQMNIKAARSLPRVKADERALKQIVLNLLSNALKFTPSGGTVTLFAHMAAGGAIAFGVKDTGMGIADDEHERVFQNFGQGRHDVAMPDKGTGLGLPIVKGLTEAHGGRVRLESEQGTGTCVTITLPASRVIAPALQAAS